LPSTDQTSSSANAWLLKSRASVERFDYVFLAQMLTYLRITGLRVGLILNFNRPVLKDGIRRVSL